LGQVWAKVAAEHFGFKSVNTFYGVTESTACNEHTSSILERAGLKIVKVENPIYSNLYSLDKQSLKAFSKVFDSP